MPDLLSMLKETEPGVLQTIAETWGVDIKAVSHADAPQVLKSAMLEPARAETVYDRLTDSERGALQAVASQKNHQMAHVMFSRLYGDFTLMGPGKIEKDKPHKNPRIPADALLYRGLVARVSVPDKAKGLVEMVYVPADLAAVLPMRKTSYDTLEEDNSSFPDADFEDDEQTDVLVIPDDEVGEFHHADTSIVDDMTTFLAYLRLHSAAVEGDDLLPADEERVLPFLIRPDIGRTSFLLCVGYSAELLTVREGRAYTRREGLQKWFGLPRWGQIKLLAEAWRDSQIYVDLFHVPSLYPDAQGFDYDPVVARHAVLDHIAKLTPIRAWWDVNSLIEVIKDSDPDFQRPDGDYDSWYLRNVQNQYLRGFESWDAVEGSLIQFLIDGPLHWLGLVDVGDGVARLNAYGRAFVGLEAFPQPADPDERIQISDDGTAYASRKVSRSDRFTLARMSDWATDADLFTYRLDPRSMERAIRDQNITPAQIEAFLKKQSDPKPVPAQVLRMLQVAQQGSLAQVTFERLLVIQTLSEDVMQHVFDDPAYRRYLGRRLGPLACVVLPDSAEELRRKLEQNGIRVEWSG